MRLTELTRYYNFDQPTVDAAREYYTTRGKPTYDPYVYKMRYSASSQQTLFDKLRGATTMIEKLKDSGWSMTNTGFFSDVFSNPYKPYILKVNSRPDRAFAWFAFLTRKFPNIHFPKIGNMKVYKHYNEKYYVYLIERLYPIQLSSEKLQQLLSALQVIANNPDKSFEQLQDYYNINLLRTVRYYINNKPELINAANIIGKYKTNKNRLDFSFQNVMSRDDGTIVITDPLAER